MKTSFAIELPEWAQMFCNMMSRETFADDEFRMETTIELTRQNVLQKTGGPFGAAIFDLDNNSLVSVGVNLVPLKNCSVLHAEIIAIILAQAELDTYDLSSKGNFALFSSTEPCAMCLGAIPWSGVHKVVTAATESDAEQIGFREGHKPAGGINVLKHNGIKVTTQLFRDRAKEILNQYAQNNGIIYNAL
jgi:tRNA(Arg) A34 adenosine deaminase TadA